MPWTADNQQVPCSIHLLQGKFWGPTWDWELSRVSLPVGEHLGGCTSATSVERQLSSSMWLQRSMHACQLCTLVTHIC